MTLEKRYTVATDHLSKYPFGTIIHKLDCDGQYGTGKEKVGEQCISFNLIENMPHWFGEPDSITKKTFNIENEITT